MKACLAPGEYMGQTVARRQFASFLATEAAFGPNTVLPLHIHEAATICIVVRGGFQERFDGKDRAAEAGMILYRPKGHAHSDRFHDSKHCTLGIDLVDDDLRLPDHPVYVRNAKASRTAAKIYGEFHRNDDCSPIAIHGLVLELRDHIAVVERGQEVSQPRWLPSVVDRLASEYRRPPSLSGLAATARIHPVHLCREFQRFMGCSIAEHVRHLRVELGRKELDSTGASIGEIALNCGFCDQAHFTRAFREFIGMAPGEYRKQH